MNLTFDISLRLLLWLGLIFLYYKGITYNYYRGFIYHYPFFVFGMLSNKYRYISEKILHSNSVFTSCLLGYAILWAFTSEIPFGFNLIAFFSIPILLYLFHKYNNVITEKLSLLGSYSRSICFPSFFHPFPISCSAVYK